MNSKYRIKESVTDELLAEIGIGGDAPFLREAEFELRNLRQGFRSQFPPDGTLAGSVYIEDDRDNLNGYNLPLEYVELVAPEGKNEDDSRFNAVANAACIGFFIGEAMTQLEDGSDAVNFMDLMDSTNDAAEALARIEQEGGEDFWADQKHDWEFVCTKLAARVVAPGDRPSRTGWKRIIWRILKS